MYLADDTGSTFDFIWMIKNSVVPRPIAWVQTQDASGRGNLAPYSYFNLVSMDPPTLMISFVGQKDSYDNIKATGEFVVNMVSDGLAEVETASAAILPAEVDEIALLGLQTLPSTRITPPRLAVAKVALECVYLSEIEVYDTRVVIGQVLGIHADDDILDDSGRVDALKYRPVGRLGGSLYTTVDNQYRHTVPAGTDEWISAQPGGDDALEALRHAERQNAERQNAELQKEHH